MGDQSNNPADKEACGACACELGKEDTVPCSVCKTVYHLACASLPGRRTKTARDKWVCSACVSNARMHDGNYNSPAPVGPRSKIIRPPSPPSTSPYATPISSPAVSPNKRGKGVAGYSRQISRGDASADPPASEAMLSKMYYDLIKSEMAKATEKQCEIVEGLKAEISKLTGIVTEFKNRCAALEEKNAELTELVDFLQGKYDTLNGSIPALESRAQRLEKDKDNLKVRVDSQASTIESLEIQIEEGEQRARANNLEIFGIPERKTENLSGVIVDISKICGTPITPSDIEFVTRVAPRPRSGTAAAASTPTSGRPKPIVVKFFRRSVKEELLRAVRKRRGVNTKDIGVPGDKRQIYVNDHLTPAKKMLFSKAREACKTLGFQYCWTSYTKVYVRKADKTNLVRIRDEKDIAALSKSVA